MTDTTTEREEEQRYYVVDLRNEFQGLPYITFWRPKNANYAYPLEWSGRYSLAELKPGYHEVRRGRTVERFAVACEVVEGLAVLSGERDIDGGPTAVVENTTANRRVLRNRRTPLPVRSAALATLTQGK